MDTEDEEGWRQVGNFDYEGPVLPLVQGVDGYGKTRGSETCRQWDGLSENDGRGGQMGSLDSTFREGRPFGQD